MFFGFRDSFWETPGMVGDITAPSADPPALASGYAEYPHAIAARIASANCVVPAEPPTSRVRVLRWA